MVGFIMELILHFLKVVFIKTKTNILVNARSVISFKWNRSFLKNYDLLIQVHSTWVLGDLEG